MAQAVSETEKNLSAADRSQMRTTELRKALVISLVLVVMIVVEAVVVTKRALVVVHAIMIDDPLKCTKQSVRPAVRAVKSHSDRMDQSQSYVANVLERIDQMTEMVIVIAETVAEAIVRNVAHNEVSTVPLVENAENRVDQAPTTKPSNSKLLPLRTK